MEKNKKASDINKMDLERGTGVLLEEVRHGLKTVAEGHGILVKKLEGHDKKFEEHDRKLDAINIAVDNTNIKLDRMECKIEKMDVKLDRVGHDMVMVKDALIDVNTISKDHEKRITKLEEKVKF